MLQELENKWLQSLCSQEEIRQLINYSWNIIDIKEKERIKTQVALQNKFKVLDESSKSFKFLKRPRNTQIMSDRDNAYQSIVSASKKFSSIIEDPTATQKALSIAESKYKAAYERYTAAI